MEIHRPQGLSTPSPGPPPRTTTTARCSTLPIFTEVSHPLVIMGVKRSEWARINGVKSPELYPLPTKGGRCFT